MMTKLAMFLLAAGILLQVLTTRAISQCSALDQLQKSINSLQAEADKLKQQCQHECSKQETNQCNKDVIAYYKFDSSFRDVCNGHNAVPVGSVQLAATSGVSNGAAFFDGTSKLRVASLNDYTWGSQFSVSVWFKRTGQPGNWQGIINNGYYSYRSWEIRMSAEISGQIIGGGVISTNSSGSWAYRYVRASFNHWHHVVMTYDGTTLNFYLDNQQQNGYSNCCQGNLVNKKNDVIIGQAGHGMANEFFYGYIDEVKLFKKALTADEVTQLYHLKHV